MININEYLNHKFYGAPYMPKDYKELTYYMELQAKYYIHLGVLWFQAQYLIEDRGLGLFYLIRDLTFFYIVLKYCLRFLTILNGYGIFGIIGFIYVWISKTVVGFIMSLPIIKSKINTEINKTLDKIDQQLILNDEKLLQFPRLPNEGLLNVKVLQELDKLQTLKHSAWDKGRVSGAVYHGGDELLELQSDAYHKYSIANQLHPDVFPGVRKMESEVVSMVLNLFNAPPEGCGSTTSGGTESLLLAGLAAREYGKKYKNITRPEIIAPVTIHAGIEKACYYFGMKLHKVSLDSNYKVNLSKVKRLINSNTVLLVGSAPNYPHGIMDDIEGLSKLAVKYNILLHVDACLGSFIVAFLDKAHPHEKVPLVDFRVPGVTSMSCDTHKYGFAPKGSSIIMYRNPQIRECQYYVSSDWTGGMYGSPTLAGSRPGALMVGCWATLVNIGEQGYLQSCKDIVGAAMKFKNTVKTHPVLSQYLEVIGDPIGSVVAFKGKGKFNIYGLSDVLNTNGWHFATLQNPAALHFAFTRLTVPIVEEMVADLVKFTEEVAETGAELKSDTASVYGVAGNVSTAGVADRIIVGFLDALYKL